MYRKYFGLNSLPFQTTPDLDMFYKQGSRQEILEALLYTVSRGDGIVKVTGEVGSGKTMLLRLLAVQLSDDFKVIYINSPNLSAKDIVLYISEELGIQVNSESQKFTIVNELKKELVRLHSIGKKVVMLVDEAQSMTFDALEEIRLLSNLETSHHKLLQMVLFGQPELDRALEHEHIRQLKSRISYSIFVPHLQPVDVQAYLNYRMRKAGYDGLDVFDLAISKKIHKLTNGLPRNINILADKILMAIYGTGDQVAQSKHLKTLPDLEQRRNFILPINLMVILGSFLFALFILVVYVVYQQNGVINSKDSFKISDSGEVKSVPETLASGLQYSSVSTLKNHKESVNLNVNPVLNGLQNNNKPLPQKIEQSIDISEAKSAQSRNNNVISISKTFNYKIKNPDALVGNLEQLKKILLYHDKGRSWIMDLEKKYVIQLSTMYIRSLDFALRFYASLGLDLNLIHTVIDYNQKLDKYRLKVFYLSSSNFSTLIKTIEALPKKIRSSQPYVVRKEQLEHNLRYTDKKLEQIGIVHE